MAVASYALVIVVLSHTLINQASRRTFDMTWRVTPSSDRGGEPGLRLEFSTFPGNYVDLYGPALSSYLRRRGSDHVAAEFVVTSDLGRVRGFRLVGIDGHSAQEIPWSAGRAVASQGSASRCRRARARQQRPAGGAAPRGLGIDPHIVSTDEAEP